MVQGNGATIETIEEFCDIADKVAATLCAHNIYEVVNFMATEAPELYKKACAEKRVQGNIVSIMSYMVVSYPALFQLALVQTSVGCY